MEDTKSFDYLYLTGYGKDCIPMKESNLLLSNPIDNILSLVCLCLVS